MKSFTHTLIAGTLATSALLVPAITGATEADRSGDHHMRGSGGLEGIGLASLEAMSDSDLESIQGGRRWGDDYLSVFNIAIAPQINICIFCNGVSQSNFAFLFGFNGMP